MSDRNVDVRMLWTITYGAKLVGGRAMFRESKLVNNRFVLQISEGF